MSDEDQENGSTLNYNNNNKTEIFTQLFNALSHVCDDAQLTCENSHKIANEH